VCRCAIQGRGQVGGAVTTHVFVYGTLKPGQSRWQILERFTVRSDAVSSASAQGRLFDTGYGWPAAVFDSRVSDQVRGVVVAIRSESINKALATLDAVEGVAGGLFRRILIDVNGQACWAYHWPGPTDEYRRVATWPEALRAVV
jgi:gamma-glutamylcyclotransferase (GGCT)/AIG2-like uncharacterized protein YtfP